MANQEFRTLIMQGMEGLPTESLAEIADFVFFIRKRVLQPKAFEDELRASLIREELKSFSRSEEAHLEQESPTTQR